MKIFIILLSLFLLFQINIVFASTVGESGDRQPSTIGESRDRQPSTIGESRDRNDSNSDLNFPNPLGTQANPTVLIPELIGRIINAVLGVVGSIALLMFVYGGLMWMTAAGNEERVKKGGSILTWAAIGLIVIFSAYAIVDLIINKVTGAV